MTRRTCVLALFGASLLFFRPADEAAAQTALPEIPNLRLVSPGLYRSARPEDELPALKELGIRTILNLEDDAAAVAREKALADGLGIRQVQRPLNVFVTPDDAGIDEILKILADPARRPLLVHCREGVDRTGLVIALHRVVNEGWEPARAYAEMKASGYHPYFWKVSDYFRKRTGLAYELPPALEHSRDTCRYAVGALVRRLRAVTR